METPQRVAADVPDPVVRSGAPSYWLTRFVVLRALGLVYVAAFASMAWQVLPLLGEHGLLPVGSFLERVATASGSRWDGFLRLPSLFWLGHSDALLLGTSLMGLALALLLLTGFANAILLALLWALHLSFVHVGQLWTGYGWEIQLAETGFLAIFLVPLVDARPFPRRAPPAVVIWLLRWLIARVMLGAGLIKLRGDPCWRDLTCLFYHYETQPIPNPLSGIFHRLPHALQKLGVIFNHVTELGAPWLIVLGRHARTAAGLLMLAFQAMLIVSGNLSFLNWLTIVPILACFDDAFLRRVLPRALEIRAERAAAQALPSRAQRVTSFVLAAVVGVLSIAPVANLVSSRQVMNTSFEPLSLVNTYGAFGTVGRERDEIVFEGTDDPTPDADSVWKAYEFPCKPGDPMRRPCVVSPFQPRLDWQIWFAAMASPADYPWTLHFTWKLLEGDRGLLRLLANDPFPAEPPRFVRAQLYRYQFAPPHDPSGAWWTRKLLGPWLRPLSLDDPDLRDVMLQSHWLE